MTGTISQSTLKRANRWKLVALIALFLMVFVIIVAVENMLVSSLIAFVIAYTLGPLVSYLERRLGITRQNSTLAVFTSVFAALTLMGLWLFPYLGETLYSLQSDMPRFIVGVGQVISEVESKMHAIAGPLAGFDLTGKVEMQLTAWTGHFFNNLPIVLQSLITVMLLAPFLAFFMVKDGRNLVRGVFNLVPNNVFEPVLSVQHQINFQIGQFVRARILESVIVGGVTALGLVIISFPYAVLLGVFAGVMNVIPYLGPVLGAVPAFLVAAVNGGSALDFALISAVYIIAQLIDAGVLIPLVVAKIVDLHPVTVIVVIIAGSQVMGILGMIISIPVASALKVTINTIYRHLVDTRS